VRGWGGGGNKIFFSGLTFIAKLKFFSANISQLFAEGEVIIGEYSPRRSRGEYLSLIY
jgi:hypothetical protein